MQNENINESATSSDALTLDELAERVAELERRMASSFPLSYSGEEIQSLLDTVNDRSLDCGRETINITSNQSTADVKLRLPFVPTKDTQVVATAHREGMPYPYENMCVVINFGANAVYASIVMGTNSPSSGTTSYLPKGEINIDWLVIRR